jgi:hypothetical protein
MNDRRDDRNVGGEDAAVSGCAEDRALAEDARNAAEELRRLAEEAHEVRDKQRERYAPRSSIGVRRNARLTLKAGDRTKSIASTRVFS